MTVLDLDSGKRITWADGGYDHLQNFLIMSDRYVVLMMDRRYGNLSTLACASCLTLELTEI